MIKLENVTFKYDKIILDNINLNIEKNKITFIIGVNASGKSTLANIISGLLYPTSGNIYLDDIKLNKHVDKKIIRKKVGVVFQNPNNQILFPKVYDDIKFTLENMKYSKKEIPRLIKNSLKKVNMIDYINDNPYKLSGGQKQKVAIASQLVYNPDYFIFDEATAFIDINGKNDIYKLIKELKKDMGIIYITNDMNELIYADDIIIIDNSKIYKYRIDDIINDNTILIKHKLRIPFILKIAKYLNIKDITKINETDILKEVGKID